jgi:hypothetical protein
MLRPTKHSDPNKTVLPIAAILLKRLRRYRTETFTDLRGHLRAKAPHLDPLFVPALNLLFLLGLVAYHRKTDSFEYRGP